MEQLISIGAVLFVLASLMIFAQAIAELTAPRLKWCAPCMTFWLTNVLLFAALAWEHELTLRAALFAVIFAFINYFYIKTKIQIYE
jgi:hypothetical protein